MDKKSTLSKYDLIESLLWLTGLESLPLPLKLDWPVYCSDTDCSRNDLLRFLHPVLKKVWASTLSQAVSGHCPARRSRLDKRVTRGPQERPWRWDTIWGIPAGRALS